MFGTSLTRSQDVSERYLVAAYPPFRLFKTGFKQPAPGLAGNLELL